MIPPSVPPLPSGHHPVPPTVPPLATDSAPIPHPDYHFGTTAFRVKVVLAFVLIFGFLVWQNVFVKDSKDRQAKNDRSEQYVAALSDTKRAYASRDYETGFREAGDKRSKRALDDEKDAVSGWKKLAESPRASAADWRRLGIVQYAFNSSNDPNAGMKAFEKAAELSTKPRTKKLRDDFETEPYLPVAKTAEAEQKFWQDVYHKHHFMADDPSRLLQELKSYQLDWFEHLAAAQIYAKAGDSANATAEKSAALTSCNNMNRLDGIRFLLLFWGFATWVWYGIRAPIHKFRPRVREFPAMDFSETDSTSNTFSFRARMTAFLLHLIIPVAAIIPFAFLRGALVSASPLVLVRVQSIAYLVFAFGAAGFALWVLRRLSDNEKGIKYGSGTPVLKRLGFPGKQPIGDALRGVHGYGMALVVTLIAGLFSEWLFHNFKTPSHPIVRELLIMRSPGDRFLILLEAAVVAAITEEIMFRGVLYPAFRERFGAARGILITSALFALAHPTLPGGFLPLMALGASFNVAYEKTGSLVPSMTMHALNNGLLILGQFALMAS